MMQGTVFYFFIFTCLAIQARYVHDESNDDERPHVEGIYDNYLVDDLATCSGLSEDVGCTNCTDFGHCLRGAVPIDPWLTFALKTQREIQIDKTFDHIMMFDGHNAYNTRADGYGANDTCDWPPSEYAPTCISLANHEFSLTDLLNMGVRALELDNWWCVGAMRLAHLLTGETACQEHHRLYLDGIKEMADWLDIPENKDEIIRIYLNEKQDQGHDSEVNDPLELFFGEKIITPLEYNETYGRQWPTMRKMREDGKNVVVATASTAGTGDFYTHGDLFIHKIFWTDIKVKEFSAYPSCGGKTRENALRFYSDSTKYGRAYDGTKQTGTILDFTEYVNCNVQYPGADQINPDMMKTGVFTWAEGEPSTELTKESCIILHGTEQRWYVATSCSEENFFACQSTEDPDAWTVSTSAGPFSLQQTFCPEGFQFSIPHDGYRQQKLIEAANGKTVWLDYTPWLPGYQPPTGPAVVTPTSTASTTGTMSIYSVLILSTLAILGLVRAG